MMKTLYMTSEGYTYIRSFGGYQLFKKDREYCLTDGWRCDWFFIYPHGGWAHDGVFRLRKDIKAWFNKLSPRTMN